MQTRFEWDYSKADSNLAKHGVSFSEALRVFADPNLLLEQDRVVDGELRWKALGVANSYLIFMVAHTSTEEDDFEVIRIISARPATRKERKQYEREARSV